MFDPRVESIFHELAELPLDARAVRLELLCPAGDPAREEVLSLLSAEDSSLLDPRAHERRALPERIGRYPILRELGRGGMGVVYLAQDLELGREVALKTIDARLAATEASRAQLRSEARALALVSQPNVAQVFALEEVSEPETRAFLTMEYVPGSNLSARMRDLAGDELLDVARQVAAGLEAAHARGIVHRDLKPQNVRITPDGWVKVLDFGLAAQVAESTASRAGTLRYMSPEQIDGLTLSDRADVWSFGCILYECLTGSPAVSGATAEALIAATREAAVDWSRIPARTPEGIRSFLKRCLDPKPTQRPSAAQARQFFEEELLRARARTLIGPVSAAVDGGAVHLPARTSAFVGRSATLERLLDAMASTRLVTIAGPGGCGKTRIAIEAARLAASRFPDGVWFLDLTPLAAGDDIVPLVARVLGVRDVAGTGTLDDALLRSLRTKRALLVVDNCEHVIEHAAEWSARALADCAALAFLATSREPLDLVEEQVIDLPRLEIPAGEANADLVRRTEAVALFEGRARSRRADFALNDDDAIRAGEICRLLDGLPLAIELAASHVRSLSVAEILERVRERPFELGQMRGVAERHQSLAGLIAWSHRLLDPEEQRLFARLAIFRGGWTASAAEAVCADEALPSWRICDLLSRLVERSLVEVVALGEAEASRYRFLETIHRFARDEMERMGDLSACESRLVAYLADWAVPDPAVRVWSADERAKEIGRDYANVTLALELALANENIAAAERLAAGGADFWSKGGLWREGTAWMHRVLDLLDRVESAPPSGGPALSLRLDVLSDLSHLHTLLEQHEEAIALSKRALDLAERSESPRHRGRAAHCAGFAAHGALDFVSSERHFAATVEWMRQAGDRAAMAAALGNLAMTLAASARVAEAIAPLEEQLKIAREVGAPNGISVVLNNLGLMNWALGRPVDALRYLDESLPIQRARGHALGTAICLNLIAEASIEIGDFARARASLAESMPERLRMGQRVGVLSALRTVSRLVDREGDPALAAEVMGSVLAIRDSGVLLLQADERTKMDAWRAHLEGRLGSPLLDEALARGASRSLEEAVDWIVSWLSASSRVR